MSTSAQKGFTLIELMITLLMIGVLGSIAIPQFAIMLEKSREGATKGNIAAIQSAIATFYADNQKILPATLDTATTTVGGIGFYGFVPYYIDVLPAVKVTGKYAANAPAADRGLGPGQTSTPNQVTLGTFSSPAFTATKDGKGWKYDPISGTVWVNSSMQTLSGMSYTRFGYE